MSPLLPLEPREIYVYGKTKIITQRQILRKSKPLGAQNSDGIIEFVLLNHGYGSRNVKSVVDHRRN